MDSESLFLALVMAVVNKYGGTVKFNIETNTMLIDVDKEFEVACAEDISSFAFDMGMVEL